MEQETLPLHQHCNKWEIGAAGVVWTVICYGNSWEGPYKVTQLHMRYTIVYTM